MVTIKLTMEQAIMLLQSTTSLYIREDEIEGDDKEFLYKYNTKVDNLRIAIKEGLRNETDTN